MQQLSTPPAQDARLVSVGPTEDSSSDGDRTERAPEAQTRSSTMTSRRSELPPPRVQDVDQVLYLDFDGVLHPESVWVEHGKPVVKTPPGHEVFENATELEALLAPYPQVRIVLSTTWQRHFGYRGAVAFLPLALQARCIGGTWHRVMGRDWFSFLTRGEQVLDDVSRRRPKKWLAIDDNPFGWTREARGHLALTHPVHGIREPHVLSSLTQALKMFDR